MTSPPPTEIEAVARELLEKFGMGYRFPSAAGSFVNDLAVYVLRYSNRRVREALEGAASVCEERLPVADGRRERVFVQGIADAIRRLAAEVTDAD